MRGFFQGNLVNCVKVAPQSAIFFSSTDYLKQILWTKLDPAVAKWHSFFAGVGAGFISQLVIYPLEPIKTRLTVAPPGQYTSPLHCVRQMMRKEGVVSLFRGVIPTLIGTIPYAGLQRYTYDWMVSKYDDQPVGSTPILNCPRNFFYGLLCGLVSSSIGMTVSYPLVVIRTRLQMSPDYRGSLDCASQILRKDGIRGLFGGLQFNLFKSVPAAAINIYFYDLVKDEFRR